ncbi:MAG: hypothetical protein IJR61_04735 [Clostridia bacterium]|nr:hypothetical protein [Clostridia bacterium]
MKIINVFKTHFDIGYTDLAKNVIKKYGGEMLDAVLDACERSADRPIGKRFVWTMAAWPMMKSLENCSADKKARAERLIKSGQLTIHALPFTTHTESLGEKDMDHLFDSAREFCEIYGTSFPKSAKMTDVPGHTIAIVKALAANGVKFLHLGCNPASTYPKVPTMFWWQDRYGNRVLTFYNDTYGSGIVPPKGWKYPVWLSMQQTNDNLGPQDVTVLDEIEKNTRAVIPDAEVIFGTMDDFYNEIIKCDLSDLPVITCDLGDTWIHGVGSYPVEIGKIRRARKTVENAVLSPDDEKKFYENSILFSEHTFGLDVKTYLTWQRSYDKESFLKERALPRYKLMEESWNEQRERADICAGIARRYESPKASVSFCFESEKWLISRKNGRPFIKNKITGREISVDYKYGIVGTEDITRFQKKYLTRIYEWAIADFGRQNYGETESRVFGLKTERSYVKDGVTYFVYSLPQKSFTDYGNALKIIMALCIENDRVKVSVTLENKQPTPYIEYGDLYFKTDCIGKKFVVDKVGYELDVMKEVAENANNLMYCVGKGARIDDVEIEPVDSPLVSFGQGAIFKFNGGKAKKRKPNFVFNLFNTMWGTNFPQWIEGDLKYEFYIYEN